MAAVTCNPKTGLKPFRQKKRDALKICPRKPQSPYDCKLEILICDNTNVRDFAKPSQFCFWFCERVQPTHEVSEEMSLFHSHILTI